MGLAVDVHFDSFTPFSRFYGTPGLVNWLTYRMVVARAVLRAAFVAHGYDLIYVRGMVPGIAFCLLNKCLLFVYGENRPKVIVQEFIYNFRRVPVWRCLHKLVTRFAVTGADLFICHLPDDPIEYSHLFHVDSRKFVFIPTCHDPRSGIQLPDEARGPIHPEGYVFAAGGPNRDWRLLAEAADLVSWSIRFHVVLGYPPSEDLFHSSKFSVSVNLPYERYLEILRGAELLVMPVEDPEKASGQMTVLDAMTCGKAVIATTGPLDFHVEDGVTGILVPPHDAASLAEAIDELLGDAAKRQGMGQAGRERVLCQFTVDAFAETAAKQCVALLANTDEVSELGSWLGRSPDESVP